MKNMISLIMFGTALVLTTGCGDKSDKPTVTMPATGGGAPKPAAVSGDKTDKAIEKSEAPPP
ncbi:hypothetical protein PX52LOC_00135 [Limnoglobus roseus]|uniref:Uncharacterized protein n=1 Tax=Limnoglobus roseus TaxID=2598579 RepID=A0A5C1A2A7_9BACT|nr:hypothetical protein PX52LOC_00135 [Limnoglobus roseus]